MLISLSVPSVPHECEPVLPAGYGTYIEGFLDRRRGTELDCKTSGSAIYPPPFCSSCPCDGSASPCPTTHVYADRCTARSQQSAAPRRGAAAPRRRGRPRPAAFPSPRTWAAGVTAAAGPRPTGEGAPWERARKRRRAARAAACRGTGRARGPLFRTRTPPHSSVGRAGAAAKHRARAAPQPSSLPSQAHSRPWPPPATGAAVATSNERPCLAARARSSRSAIGEQSRSAQCLPPVTPPTAMRASQRGRRAEASS